MGLVKFLESFRGAVFKLLPMKEEELLGVDQHLKRYIETLIVNGAGALKTYPVLTQKKQFLYVINNLNFLFGNGSDFTLWRKTVLDSTRYIDDLCVIFQAAEATGNEG